jgi:N6-adenosine-specific RNA methylase IME4
MIPLPTVEGGFTTILADPPWAFKNTASRGAAEDHYPTMTVPQIAALPIKDLVATSAHLFLWTTDAHLPDVFRVGIIEEWGFKFVQTLKWIKVKDGRPQMGMGNYWRHASELCLFAVRGKCPPMVKDQLDFFWAARGEHSAKPVEFYPLIERFSPGPDRLELFARSGREGWRSWGNQSPEQLAHLEATGT